MDFHRALFDKLITLKAVKWHRILENYALVVSLFNRVLLVIADRLTKETCVGAYLLAKRVIEWNRKSGPL